MNIELKTDVIHYQDIEEKVYQLVKRLKVEDKVYYSSFYLPSLLKMREIDPHVYVGYLMEFHYKKKYQELIEHDLKAFHPRYNFLTQEHIIKKSKYFYCDMDSSKFKRISTFN